MSRCIDQGACAKWGGSIGDREGRKAIVAFEAWFVASDTVSFSRLPIHVFIGLLVGYLQLESQTFESKTLRSVSKALNLSNASAERIRESNAVDAIELRRSVRMRVGSAKEGAGFDILGTSGSGETGASALVFGWDLLYYIPKACPLGTSQSLPLSWNSISSKSRA